MSSLEFVHLTSTLMATADGRWHIQKGSKPRSGEPTWWLLRREVGDRFKRVGSADTVDEAKAMVKEYDYS